MKKHYVRVLTAFLLLILLCGCGSRHGSSDSYMKQETWAAAGTMDYAEDYEIAAAAPAQMMGGGMYNGSVQAPMMTAAAAETAAEGSAVSEDDLSGTASEETPVARKLIRNVNLSLQTTEYDAVVENIRSRVAEVNGYIEQSDAHDSGYYGRAARSMNMTVRVPNDRLDAFLENAINGAKVINRSENTQDITLRYTDLEARVATLEVERDRLMELLAEAENIESIIALENRLSDIRYELESIKSSLRVYDNQVAYSTVRIDLQEVQVLTETKEATFTERVSAKFRQNLLDLMDTVTDLLIDVISNLPGIILLIIVIWAIVRIVTAILGKESREARREKKQRKKELKQKKKEEKLMRKQAGETPAPQQSTDQPENGGANPPEGQA
ncbi:MAG: DUF4349 domain-containing protein [Lachnospiraceae bacterium]|nr:DUF4349 domain-containing protein [Lachnospiraceae bacterium]